MLSLGGMNGLALVADPDGERRAVCGGRGRAARCVKRLFTCLTPAQGHQGVCSGWPLAYRRWLAMASGCLRSARSGSSSRTKNPPARPCSESRSLLQGGGCSLALPSDGRFTASDRGEWCRRLDSNQRPRAYESPTLPLSYVGARLAASCAAARIVAQPRRCCQGLRHVRTLATIATPVPARAAGTILSPGSSARRRGSCGGRGNQEKRSAWSGRANCWSD